MAYETITVETDERIGLIQLNRPEALNALNAQLLEELGKALTTFDATEKVRVVIISGSDKAFAAGADIKEMAEQGFVEMFGGDVFAKSGRTIGAIRKPIIAAVSGYALGGGCELALMCDVILAADTAKFGLPEINLGVMPGMGGTQRLTRLIGKPKAMEMILTGRQMSADEAQTAGLVSRVVPAKDLMPEAMKVAGKIAEKAPLSVFAAKEAVNRAYETTLNEGLLFERRVFHALFATEDQAEGMEAFAEKRTPQFRGR